ncbi:MAG TPA: hypothetical protein VLH18_03045, partial [Candidatus Limnocylindrales bacterium]|nr:hypothetical protein [Candidatus Limnocylindrales bacterium]
EANLRTIEGAIMMHQASVAVPATTAAALQTALVPAFLAVWPGGPDGTTYQVIGEGTLTAPYRAQATRVGEHVWWTAVAATISIPVDWTP